MNWYLAKLVFRIVCGQGDHPPQFDEQLRLIHADDELHAFYKARLLGEGDCLDETADQGGTPQWKFIDVSELHLINDFADGAEVWSTIREEPDADLYIRSVRKTATQLLQRGLHQFTGLNNLIIGKQHLCG